MEMTNKEKLREILKNTCFIEGTTSEQASTCLDYMQDLFAALEELEEWKAIERC